MYEYEIKTILLNHIKYATLQPLHIFVFILIIHYELHFTNNTYKIYDLQLLHMNNLQYSFFKDCYT